MGEVNLTELPWKGGCILLEQKLKEDCEFVKTIVSKRWGVCASWLKHIYAFFIFEWWFRGSVTSQLCSFIAHSKSWSRWLLERIKWQFSYLNKSCGQSKSSARWRQGKQTNQPRQQMDLPLAFMFWAIPKEFLGMVASVSSTGGTDQKRP